MTASRVLLDLCLAGPPATRIEDPARSFALRSFVKEFPEIGGDRQQSVLIALFQFCRNAKHRAAAGEVDAKPVVAVPIQLKRFSQSQP